MTDDKSAKPRVDHHGSVLGQVIAGLIVLGIGAVATWILGLLAEAKAPIWWYAVGIAAAAFVATLVFPPWRGKVWGWVRRPVRWIGGLRITTAASRKRALPRLTGEQMHAKSLAADPSIASPPTVSTPSTPSSKSRALEIIEHKAQQIETERMILQQMFGRATDNATINKFLDGKAALDDREKLLEGERRALAAMDKIGHKVIRPQK